MLSLPRRHGLLGLAALCASLAGGCAATVSMPADWDLKTQFLTLHQDSSSPHLCAVGKAPKVGKAAQALASGQAEAALLAMFAGPQMADDTGLGTMVSGRLPTELAYYTYFGTEGPSALVCTDLNVLRGQAQTGEAYIEGLSPEAFVALVDAALARAKPLRLGESLDEAPPAPAQPPTAEPMPAESEASATEAIAPEGAADAAPAEGASPAGDAPEGGAAEAPPEGGAGGP